MRPIVGVLVFSVLLGCGVTAERYVVSAPEVTERQNIAFSSVEIREISLPAYAASDEITTQDVDGRLSSDGSVLWADTPDRAVSLELSRALAQMTGARIASAPWPFEAFPDARLDVRFETLLAGVDGQYRARGQYFVAVPDGGRERSGLFDLSVPIDPNGGASAIATARGVLIQDLATFIARRALR